MSEVPEVWIKLHEAHKAAGVEAEEINIGLLQGRWDPRKYCGLCKLANVQALSEVASRHYLEEGRAICGAERDSDDVQAVEILWGSVRARPTDCPGCRDILPTLLRSKPNSPAPDPEWESVGTDLLRHPVPGGWLYLKCTERAMCFVPDRNCP